MLYTLHRPETTEPSFDVCGFRLFSRQVDESLRMWPRDKSEMQPEKRRGGAEMEAGPEEEGKNTRVAEDNGKQMGTGAEQSRRRQRRRPSERVEGKLRCISPQSIGADDSQPPKQRVKEPSKLSGRSSSLGGLLVLLDLRDSAADQPGTGPGTTVHSASII